eukprot:2680947-Pyramimonas_sp.AAC.1
MRERAAWTAGVYNRSWQVARGRKPQKRRCRGPTAQQSPNDRPLWRQTARRRLQLQHRTQRKGSNAHGALPGAERQCRFSVQDNVRTIIAIGIMASRGSSRQMARAR